MAHQPVAALHLLLTLTFLSMADQRLTALTELTTGNLNSLDNLYTVDVSDTSDDAAGSSKKITLATLRDFLITAGLNITSVSSNYTATTTDDVIILNSGTETVMLPLASTVPNKRYVVKCTTNAPTTANVAASGGTIDSQANFVFATQNEAKTFLSDGGTNYYVI